MVDERGYVDYDALERDREPLDAYVAWLARDGRAPRGPDGRAAFWINAYNALVLWAVLEEGRPERVTDVQGWLPIAGAGFFFERAYAVDGEQVSLWEIENERLRNRTQDYRVHAALNCATRSCPPLRPELYAADALDAQLDDQMARWVADPERGLRVEEGALHASAIFDGYARDFHDWAGGEDLCALAARYAEEPLRAELRALAARGCPRRALPWDGRLNEISAIP